MQDSRLRARRPRPRIAEIRFDDALIASDSAKFHLPTLSDQRYNWVHAWTAALDEDDQRYRRYTLHGVSHMLGIDVHDCAHARSEVYRKGPLQPGYVLTVEPGLYFQPDDLTVPEDLRGIGVRIEDDIVVTDGDPINLSAALPRTSADVEAWMARLLP